jgi:hypothetical protein
MTRQPVPSALGQDTVLGFLCRSDRSKSAFTPALRIDGDGAFDPMGPQLYLFFTDSL